MYVLETKDEIIDKYWYYSIKRIMLIIVNYIDFIDEFTDKSVINFYTFNINSYSTYYTHSLLIIQYTFILN